jgi:hypothetical protein
MTDMDRWTGVAAPVGRDPSLFMVIMTIGCLVHEHLKESLCEY